MLSSNRIDTFWTVHCKRKPGGEEFFSGSFKDLVASMLAYNPHERPSIAEIKAHEWYTGPVPTYEEIQEEFTNRKETLKNSNNQADQPIPQDVAPASVFQANTVYKSGDGDDEDEKLPELKRQAAEYLPECKRYTEFYSTSSVEDLFNTVAMYAKDYAIEFSFDDEEYSTTMKIRIDDDIVTLKVNILHHKDGNNWVEVVKERGDKFVFHDAYHGIKKYFGGHANLAEITA